MRLANKIAIVTGAAGGMGKAAALLFAREGARVALVDIKGEGIAEVAQEMRAAGGEAIAITADITVTEDVKRIGAETVAAFGPPNVLFNNAGLDGEGRKPLLDIEEADFDRTVAVNYKSVFLMIKHIAPLMIEAGGGSIVNTASIGAFIACSTAGYCGAKAGVVALGRVAAVELAQHGIRVNALCPGATMTPMVAEQRKKLAGQPIKGVDDIIGRMGVMGRLGEPEEMARMALFLASDESSFVTGASFNNDGGWTAMSGVDAVSLRR